MKKYKKELLKIATFIEFDLPKETEKIQSKNRTNRNKVEIEIYNTINK